MAAEAEAYEAEFVLPVTAAELAAARAAAAAAEEEEEEAAAAKEAEEGEAAAREAAAARAKAKKGGKRGGGGGGRGKKGGGGGRGRGGGAAACESEFGPDDEGGHQMGPSKAKLLGKGRVRRRPPGGVKAEAGGGEEGARKLVAPLEELDDSGELGGSGVCVRVGGLVGGGWGGEGPFGAGAAFGGLATDDDASSAPPLNRGWNRPGTAAAQPLTPVPSHSHPTHPASPPSHPDHPTRHPTRPTHPPTPPAPTPKQTSRLRSGTG